jgi:hypothetical protein
VKPQSGRRSPSSSAMRWLGRSSARW